MSCKPFRILTGTIAVVILRERLNKEAFSDGHVSEKALELLPESAVFLPNVFFSKKKETHFTHVQNVFFDNATL